MRGLSTELKVGFFAIIVILILAFMTFKVGGLDLMKKGGNVYNIYFRNIAGLDEKTKVKIAGVDAGIIEKIELREGQALLMVRIKKDIPVYHDAVASIKATGLLGDKYLEIKTGAEKPDLKSGDTIQNVVEFVDIDDMVRKLSKVSENITTLATSLNEALGTEEAKKSLRETILNMGDITARLDQAISVNDRKLRTALDNITSLTASINDLIEKNSGNITSSVANIKDFSDSLKTDGPQLVANLNKAALELKELVDESRPRVQSAAESIENIAKKIEKGEGTLGKLIQDDHLYQSVSRAAEGIDKTVSAVDRFRTFITFQADYLSKTSEGKGYFSVTLQPKPDKYYILGVVSDPLGKVTTKEITKNINGTETRIEEAKTEKRIEFTAQFAKRFKDLALRIGMTENTFGAGADYFFMNDRGKVTADVWDISNDEEDAKNPHLRFGLDYFVFRNLFISAGVDNIMNKKWRGGYAGAGLRFEDEDLKYLFGTLPRISP